MMDTADEQRNTMNDEQRTVNDNDTVRQTQKNRETHRAATHRGVVKNQHTVGERAIAEKRSRDF